MCGSVVRIASQYKIVKISRVVIGRGKQLALIEPVGGLGEYGIQSLFAMRRREFGCDGINFSCISDIQCAGAAQIVCRVFKPGLANRCTCVAEVFAQLHLRQLCCQEWQPRIVRV